MYVQGVWVGAFLSICVGGLPALQKLQTKETACLIGVHPFAQSATIRSQDYCELSISSS